MNSKVISVVAQLTAKPGQEEELGRRLRDMIEPTLAEKGCIDYKLHRSSDDPATWMFYENWESKEDLDVHILSKHFIEFHSISSNFLANDMIVQYFTPA
ncbi:putative quinol monooxygenase [Xenorhabdus kozodoii]|uniref:Antibiotic biosynthesis monooxygenase n=1 Tax=Xenorhabdus kozodoii TaxID=351676 RepID=A0A2D0LC79_9GAMM|nr:putative quinol monooxygenase [Xenorhabdus kozodoii]PHM73262.1 antibiotic biosynthesis monooxygenase [Xenorhabdus kozodoii]